MLTLSTAFSACAVETSSHVERSMWQGTVDGICPSNQLETEALCPIDPKELDPAHHHMSSETNPFPVKCSDIVEALSETE